MDPRQAHGVPFSVTHTGNPALATKAAVAGKRHYITDIMASSDTAGAIVQVKQGSTVIWQCQLQVVTTGSLAVMSHSFVTPLRGEIGAAVSITVNGTTAEYANIAGFTL